MMNNTTALCGGILLNTEERNCLEMNGYIHSTESFGAVDGPGVRFIIFTSGCPMRCKYCHNPDTWDMTKGEERSVDELIKLALRYKPYWQNDGGITVSGGEPLMQIDFLIELFKKAKENGVHTTIDTSGQPFRTEGEFFEKFKELMQYTDLVMLDIKHIDDDEHRELTTHTNQNILALAQFLDEIKKPVWIRHVLIPAVTDNDEYLKELSEFVSGLNNVEKIEVLPYHTLGIHKWEELGYEYKLDGVDSPTPERVANAKSILGAE